jgi:hypothetical protein
VVGAPFAPRRAVDKSVASGAITVGYNSHTKSELQLLID